MKISTTYDHEPFDVPPPAKGQRARACINLYELNERHFNSKSSDEQNTELIEALATVLKELEGRKERL